MGRTPLLVWRCPHHSVRDPPSLHLPWPHQGEYSIVTLSSEYMTTGYRGGFQGGRRYEGCCFSQDPARARPKGGVHCDDADVSGPMVRKTGHNRQRCICGFWIDETKDGPRRRGRLR